MLFVFKEQCKDAIYQLHSNKNIVIMIKYLWVSPLENGYSYENWLWKCFNQPYSNAIDVS